MLIYTLEGFQKHPQIDAIEVVCIDGWHDVLWAYAKQFGITKLKWIISRGTTGQESIRNGVYNLEDKCKPDDIVIIYDGIRPLVDDTVLSDVIIKCEQYGNAVTSLPRNDLLFEKSDSLLKLGIDEQRYNKIILWLPTYRKATHNHEGIDGNLDCFGLSKVMKEDFYFFL